MIMRMRDSKDEEGKVDDVPFFLQTLESPSLCSIISYDLMCTIMWWYCQLLSRHIFATEKNGVSAQFIGL